MIDDATLRIGRYELASRLIVGTGKYPSLEIMQQAHAASGTSMVTVAIRRCFRTSSTIRPHANASKRSAARR